MKRASSDNLRKVRDLFEVVADLPEAERSQRLDELCAGDSELRNEVAGLLDAGERAGNFLSEPEISPENAMFAPLGLEEGSTIGKYRLLEQIGEGANAVVYMVEQIETLRRRAALKVIKLGMDTHEVIARFETERQALAIMDHPNISKVLDAGATHSGRPYFVMELVKGIPITDYCDKNRLSTRERLELFIVVCQALQHAHLKGLIHRDVKPSNVLVTLHDGAPVPKVIDFGIAKAMETKLTDRTLFTRFHQFIGTPAYMSPEQAEMSGLDIDTRSDIYSLGVLLYELLTGSTPFDGKQLLESGYPEIQRVIREKEPDTPSTRLRTLSLEGLTAVSKSRSIQPGELCSGLKGDLDWIVMKALEKDRTRRYETASDFIRDVRRHLANEPVEAGRPSRIYRLKKFVRRHRSAVIAGTLVTVSLVVALLIASYGLVAARRDAGEARRQTEKAKVVIQLLDEMFQSAAPGSSKGGDFTVRELLDDFSSRMSGQLASEPEVEMTLRRTMGIAYEGLGEYVQAENHLRRASELAGEIFEGDSSEVLELQSRLAWLTHELGNSTGAETALESIAPKQLELLGRRDAGYLRTLSSLAAIKLETGNAAVAEELAKEVLAAGKESGSAETPWMMQVLMKSYRDQGKVKEADELSERLVALAEVPEGDAAPRTFEAIHTVVIELIADQNYDSAEEMARRGIQLALRTLDRGHRMTLQLMGDLGRIAHSRGDQRAAAKIYEDVLSQQKEYLGEQHLDTIQTMLELVKLRLDQNDGKSAESLAYELYSTASERFGDADEITIESVCSLAEAMQRQGNFTKAESSLRRAYEVAQNAFGPTHDSTILCTRKLGELNARQKNWSEAEKYFREVFALCEEKYGVDSPEALAAMSELSNALEKMYRFHEAQELAMRLKDAGSSLVDRHRLATVYRRRALPGPAIKMLEGVYGDALEEHGKDSKITLQIMMDLAESYSIFSDNKRALEIATEGVAIASEALGAEDQLTRRLVSARNSIQKARTSREKVEEQTRKDYRSALSAGRGVEKAWAQWLYAINILQDNDKSLREAAKYLEDARSRSGEENTFEVLYARHLSAWTAKRCFEDARAESEFLELLDDQEEILGATHWLTLRTLKSYVDFLVKRGRLRDSEALLDRWQDRNTGTEWPGAEVLVPRGGRWLFLNFERDEGTAWREFGPERIRSSAGSAWSEGVAPFGYGMAGPATMPLLVDGRYSHITHYFRKSFEVADPEIYSALKIRLRREGGAAVYLNGVEVLRDNLVPGAAFNTTSETGEHLDLYAAYVFTIDPQALQKGTNIIAVEVHQEKPESPAMAFDLELSGKPVAGPIQEE